MRSGGTSERGARPLPTPMPRAHLAHQPADPGGKPDLIIGNYSDGNLVASLLSHRCARVWFVPPRRRDHRLDVCGTRPAAPRTQPPPTLPPRNPPPRLPPPLPAARMFVTQCNIAHAIEKTKYQDADIKW